MNIEWKEGAVCFADGRQWSFNDSVKPYSLVSNMHGTRLESYIGVINMPEFQLNTIKQGDYIPKSELDTEDKYNRAVEVFGLFGFEFNQLATEGYRDFYHHESLTCCSDGLWQTSTDRWNERKITFNQLMAIGELKRLVNERESNYSARPNSSVSKVNRDIERNKQSNTLTEEEETELKSRAMASELDRQGEEWPQVGGQVEHKGRAYYYVCKSPFDGEAVLTPIDVDGWDVISVPYNELQKPKSKEDLLIEELQAKLIDNNAVDTWMLAADIVNGNIEGLSYKSSEVVK